MKQFVISFFLILFLFSSFICAEDIDTLLNTYAQENDLSKKTKKEAAGTVIVYTKQDLERMQVKSLSELLKGIPFYSYNENKLGYTDLAREIGFPTVGRDARVYINEREVISPFYGHSLGLVSKFDLSYIDHIEIYTGVTSFEFGVEPANMVIRLYTKDPNREVGGQFKTATGTNKSNETSISYSDILNDFSYYAYLNVKNTNEDVINDASRDKQSKHVFLSLQNDTNRIEYNRIEGKSDLFMDGIGGGDGSTEVNETEADYNLIGWYSTYLDERLSLSLDYISDKSTTEQSDDEALNSLVVDGGLFSPLLVGVPQTVSYDSYSVKQKEKQISAVLKYRESIGKHDLLGGLQYRKKDFKFTEIKANVTSPFVQGVINVDEKILPNLFGFTSEKVYSAFLEDTYSINDNQAIVGGVKRDFVNPNGVFENQNLSLYRLGYIYSQEEFTFKTFLISTESRFQPNFYTRDTVVGNLEPQRDDSINIEATWNKKPYKYSVNLFKTKQTNRLYSYNNIVKNLDKPYYKQGVSFRYSFNFDYLNRVDTNFYIMNKKNTYSNEKDTFYGGYIRFLNSIGKFDFYNELIYRDGYELLDAGYDFNSAITYKHSKDLLLSLKGENIFDKALKTFYSINDDDYDDSSPVSVSTRKFWLTMEYRF